GLRLALGRGLIGMVLADLYTAISGIGYLIVRTASTYQVDKMFVPIVTLGLLGVTLTALLRLAEKYVAPWTAASRDDYACGRGLRKKTGNVACGRAIDRSVSSRWRQAASRSPMRLRATQRRKAAARCARSI